MHAKRDIGHVTLGVKARRAVWNTARWVLFRPFGTKLFRPWRIGLLRMFGAQAARGSEVYASARIWAPWLLTLGEDSCIGPKVTIYNQARVTLGARACLSEEAYVCTAGHATDEVNNATTGLQVAEVTIEADAWIGTRAFVGMGVTVGQGAIVGACACVFKDVEPRTVVGGNPAQPIRRLGNRD